MAPDGCIEFNNEPGGSAWPWWRRLRAFSPLIVLPLILPLLSLSIGPGNAQVTPTGRPHHHVYLLRGVLNLSPGLDEIAAKLQRQGINATVHNHLAWPLLADEAAADYKSGRATAIVLVGHSAGAAAVTSMGARLGALGVPVRLAIGMDPVWPTTASGHIGRYVNYYSDGAGMAVDKSPQFRGSFQNVDLKNMPSIGHFNIDTDARMQTKVIASIRAALYGDRHAALKPEIAASPGSTAAAAAR